MSEGMLLEVIILKIRSLGNNPVRMFSNHR